MPAGSEMKPKSWYLMVSIPENKKSRKIEQSEALTFEAVAREWHKACKRNGQIPTAREF
jgi:hypothetical protein